MFKIYKNNTHKKDRRASESRLQAKCVVDMQNYYPQQSTGFFAVTNNSENRIKGALNKAMGVKEGVSDTIYVKEGKVLFIEFKKPRGGKQSEKQKDFEYHVIACGFKYVICNDYLHFWAIVGLPCPEPNYIL